MQRPMWQFTLPDVSDAADALRFVAAELGSLYVDLGFDDELSAIRHDVELAGDTLAHLT